MSVWHCFHFVTQSLLVNERLKNRSIQLISQKNVPYLCFLAASQKTNTIWMASMSKRTFYFWKCSWWPEWGCFGVVTFLVTALDTVMAAINVLWISAARRCSFDLLCLIRSKLRTIETKEILVPMTASPPDEAKVNFLSNESRKSKEKRLKCT